MDQRRSAALGSGATCGSDPAALGSGATCGSDLAALGSGATCGSDLDRPQRVVVTSLYRVEPGSRQGVPPPRTPARTSAAEDSEVDRGRLMNSPCLDDNP